MAATYAPLLARIDDRLIHGQVVVGCCEPLDAGHIVLVDDAVRGDPLQQKLYRAGVPPEVEVEFVGVGDAGPLLADLQRCGALDRVVVVVARAAVIGRLREHGVTFARVQLGGAHAREGAHEIVPGIFLDREDREALHAILEIGTEVEIQPVASAAAVRLDSALLGRITP